MVVLVLGAAAPLLLGGSSRSFFRPGRDALRQAPRRRPRAGGHGLSARAEEGQRRVLAGMALRLLEQATSCWPTPTRDSDARARCGQRPSRPSGASDAALDRAEREAIGRGPLNTRVGVVRT